MIKKYTLEIGNDFQIVEHFTVFMNEEDLVGEWTDDDRLVEAIDDQIQAMYWDYKDEDEEFEDFQGEMGYKIIEPIDDELYEILYDCRE